MKKILLISLISLLLPSAAEAHLAIHKANPAKMAQRVKLPAKRQAKNRRANSIITAPEGTLKEYMQSTYAYFSFWGSVYDFEDAGLAGEVVWNDATSTAYVKNPISQFISDTYMEGKVEGDKIIFTFPQKFFEEEDYGDVYTYNLDVFEYFEDEDGGWYKPATDRRTVTFDILADGSLQMEDTNFGDYIIGVEEDGEWAGYGDFDILFTPFSGKMLTTESLPEGLTLKKWQLTDAENGTMVNAGAKDGKFYISHLPEVNEDVMIEGDIEGDKVVFKSGQYIGIDWEYNYRLFFDAVDVEEEYDEEWDEYTYYYSLLPQISFDYYEEENLLTSTENCAIAGGPEDNLQTIAAYRNPEMRILAEDADPVPANPEIISLNIYDSYGFGEIKFIAPNLNIDGDLLDTSNLYYRLFIDGEPFEFTTDDYWGIDEDMTDVPYYFTDSYDFLVNGTTRTVALSYTDFDSIGVQMVNKVDGVEYTSDVVYYDDSAVLTPDADKEIASEKYFDLTGRRVASPAKGLYLRTVRYTDGTVRTFKMIND